MHGIINSRGDFMSKNYKNKTEEYVVFNKQILLFLFISILTFIASTHTFREDTTISISLLAFGIFLLLLILMIPTKFIFSNKQLRVIWLLPIEKTIFWSNVTTIIENSFFSAIDDLSNFQIIYNSNYKGKSMVKVFKIPRNKKTKFYLNKYAKYKIT